MEVVFHIIQLWTNMAVRLIDGYEQVTKLLILCSFLYLTVAEMTFFAWIVYRNCGFANMVTVLNQYTLYKQTEWYKEDPRTGPISLACNVKLLIALKRNN